MENSPHSPPPTEPPPEEKRGVANSIVVGVIGVVSAIYLFNPTAGLIELIPDNIPVIGNLDEAAAAALLISTLAYFGIDLGRLFGKARKSEPKTRQERNGSTTIDADFVER
jgi:uncharacterized membrane protein YkvA (DUF1232 family)